MRREADEDHISLHLGINNFSNEMDLRSQAESRYARAKTELKGGDKTPGFIEEDDKTPGFEAESNHTDKESSLHKQFVDDSIQINDEQVNKNLKGSRNKDNDKLKEQMMTQTIE